MAENRKVAELRALVGALSKEILNCKVADRIAELSRELSSEGVEIHSSEGTRLDKAFALACRQLQEFSGIAWQGLRKEILSIVDNEPVCRICGCTQNNACDGGCYWAEEDLCSSCAQDAERIKKGD